MNALGHDLVYAVRVLRRLPALSITCIVSLAIGIGSSTTTYQSIRDFYFADVPGVGDAAGLVRTATPVSYPAFEAFRRESGAFAEVAAYMAPVPFLVTVRGNTERVYGHLVTANYFDVLRAPVSFGVFGSKTANRDAVPEVIVSRRFWESRLGANPAAVGRPLQVNHQPVMLAGVAASDFLGASPLLEGADLWIPVTVRPTLVPELANRPLDDPMATRFRVIGRLPVAMTRQSAEARLDAAARQFATLHRLSTDDRPAPRATLVPGGRVIPLGERERLAASVFPALMIGLLLWVACSNVANLLLARAAARRREIALRLALGASRWRVVRQLIAESVLLSVAGGLAGLLLVWWSIATLDWFRPVFPEYSILRVNNDWTVLGFSVALSVGTGLLFGLAPALQATRHDVAGGLKASSAPSLPGIRWFGTRNMIVLQQLGASLMLLLLTGFILLGVYQSATPDLGFNPHHLYRMSLDPVREGYPVAKVQALFPRLIDRLKAEPGVEAIAISMAAPLEPFNRSAATTVRLPDPAGTHERADPKALTRVTTDRVGAGFFETAQIGVVQGRSFTVGDERELPGVAIVNDHLARDFYPGSTAIGRSLELNGARVEIVGVAHDIRSNAVFSLPQRHVYLPIRPGDLMTPGAKGTTVLVRVAPGVPVEALMRRNVAAVAPALTVFDLRSMDDRVEELLSFVRMTLFVYGGIGVFSLALAAIGLAGVTAYAVAQRRREIGVRIALGARRVDILRLVMRESAWIVTAGTVLGVVSGYAALRVLNSWLDALAQATATSASDPALLIGAPLASAVLTMLACYLPARRSLRIDPATALREEC